MLHHILPTRKPRGNTPETVRQIQTYPCPLNYNEIASYLLWWHSRDNRAFTEVYETYKYINDIVEHPDLKEHASRILNICVSIDDEMGS